MKKLQIQLKSIAKSLSALVKQVETVSKQIEKQKPVKAVAPKKAAVKKVVAKKAPAKKTTAKKVVAKKAPAKKTTAKKVVAKKAPIKKAAAKKAPAKKATPAKMSVIDTVKSLVARSHKGVTISALKEKTGFDSRQLSNALYKLAKRGKIASKARGLYVKK